MCRKVRYKIDVCVPLVGKPSITRNYPFAQMEVGDSFFVPEDEAMSLPSSASRFGTRCGVRFTIQVWGSGYRCWRIE